MQSAQADALFYKWERKGVTAKPPEEEDGRGEGAVCQPVGNCQHVKQSNDGSNGVEYDLVLGEVHLNL